MAKDAGNVEVTNEGWNTLVKPFAPTWAPEDGDTLTGVFLGSRMVEQDDLQNPGEKREAPVYEVKDSNGQDWSVWGSYALDEAFESIAEGQEVRITYHGKEQIDNGRRSVKKYTVQYR